jgi:hypothetical protein
MNRMLYKPIYETPKSTGQLKVYLLIAFILISVIALIMYLTTRNSDKNNNASYTGGYGCPIPGDWNSTCNKPTVCKLATPTSCGVLTASCAKEGGGRNTSTVTFSYDTTGTLDVENDDGTLKLRGGPDPCSRLCNSYAICKQNCIDGEENESTCISSNCGGLSLELSNCCANQKCETPSCIAGACIAEN